MIHGIGCDLLERARVEALYQRYGDKLLQRVLTDAEQQQAKAQHSPVGRLSKYLAAKEAAFKALGVGRSHGLSWQDFSVGYRQGGQPVLHLSAKVLALLPEGAQCHLSLSDTDTHALAYVVCEVPRR